MGRALTLPSSRSPSLALSRSLAPLPASLPLSLTHSLLPPSLPPYPPFVRPSVPTPLLFPSLSHPRSIFPCPALPHIMRDERYGTLKQRACSAPHHPLPRSATHHPSLRPPLCRHQEKGRRDRGDIFALFAIPCAAIPSPGSFSPPFLAPTSFVFTSCGGFHLTHSRPQTGPNPPTHIPLP